MTYRKLLFFSFALALFAVPTGGAQPKPGPLDAWKPRFDPSRAKYVLKVSAVSSPAIEGFAAGYRIRDELWEKTRGQVYYDYYPLSQLGGELDVLNQLTAGDIQGMLCSSVVAPRLAPRLGVVNLPFLIDSFDKLDKFTGDRTLFEPLLKSCEEKGVLAVDITGYGNYGWASTKPIRTLAAARLVKFRIAEGDVNQSVYRAWGFPVFSMPWPDVHIALKQGVIGALDHTPMVCGLTKKFEVAKFFTQVDYAQGLLFHLYNKRWLETLPAELRKIVLEVTRSECAKTRELTRKQEEGEIGRAKAAGVEFIRLSPADVAVLKRQSEVVFREWRDKIGPEYLSRVEKRVGYR